MHCLRESGLLEETDPSLFSGDTGFIGAGMITPIRKPRTRDLMDCSRFDCSLRCYNAGNCNQTITAKRESGIPGAARPVRGPASPPSNPARCGRNVHPDRLPQFTTDKYRLRKARALSRLLTRSGVWISR
jgi:hypothetical protein